MVDRRILKELRKKGFTFVYIAKKFGVSRQRIHQIYHNYRNFGFKGRSKIYNLAWKDMCEVCGITPTYGLHHKDGNNLNDSPENLISVCSECHGVLHRKWTNCSSCKVALGFKHVDRRLGLCKDCYNVQKRGYVKGTWSKRQNECKNCKRSIVRHFSSGYCRSCFNSKVLGRNVSYFRK